MYLAYLLDESNAVLGQVFDLNEVYVKQKVNDIWVAEFTLFKDNRECQKEHFTHFRKVILKKLIWNEEKLIFTGYVTSLNANLESVRITLSSEEILLKKRINKIKYDSLQPINTALQNMLNNINSRTWESFTLDSDITSEAQMNFKAGHDMFYILKTLAEGKYRFALKGDTLTFKTLVWEDRSSWNNYFEYSYDVNEPSNRNIKHLEIEDKFDSIANSLYMYSGWWHFHKDVAAPLILEESVWVKALDAALLDGLFDIFSKSESKYKILPMTDDFWEVSLWDYIKCRVISNNDFLRIDEKLEVSEKIIESDWRMYFKLSKPLNNPLSTGNRLDKLEKEIKSLEM